jgi:hypothetical protein
MMITELADDEFSPLEATFPMQGYRLSLDLD